MAIRVLFGGPTMKWLFLVTLAVPLAIWAQDEAPDSTNINSRYTIEKVSITGPHSRLSLPLKSQMDRFVGQKLDPPRLDKLAAQMKREFHASDVAVNITKGSLPNHVQVNFEVKSRQQRFDMSVAKFLYDSKDGWSGEGTATTRVDGNAFTFALVSDGDVEPDRFAGMRAKYGRDHLGPGWAGRLGLDFEFDAFHDEWNPATALAAEGSPDTFPVYRDRHVFTPEARLYLAEPLELDFGVRFARYRLSTPGANTESSNAVVSTLRYHQRWDSDSGAVQQGLDGTYSIEDATRVLESDPVYARHLADLRYELDHGRSKVLVCFLAGTITGRAPLFDRFVLGNASTLRGWNKYALDPLGGSHMIHGSIDYDYRFFQIFYDTGAIWDRVQDREQKQSLGAGFKKAPFQLAVAFPVRAGRADPVFFAGMNF